MKHNPVPKSVFHIIIMCNVIRESGTCPFDCDVKKAPRAWKINQAGVLISKALKLE
jgi:hypothetical protein